MSEENWVEINNAVEWYTDGGSIGIQCFGRYKDKSIKDYGNIITIDYSLSTPAEEQGQWYVGWKNKDGILIDDEEFKKQIIEDIKYREGILNQILYTKIIPSLRKPKQR